MLQLDNPGSTGNSNYPVLGELGPAARVLVSITGVKHKGACPVAGDMSLLDNKQGHEKLQPESL